MTRKPDNWEELVRLAEILSDYKPAEDYKPGTTAKDKISMARTYHQIATAIMEIPHWSFDIGTGKRQNAVCYFDRQMLRYHRLYVEAATKQQLFNTVTHEVAHAVLPPGHKHGYWWKKLHRAMGGNAKRCTGSDKKIPFKYHINCTECGEVWKRLRKSKLVKRPEIYTCACGGSLKVKEVKQ